MCRWPSGVKDQETGQEEGHTAAEQRKESNRPGSNPSPPHDSHSTSLTSTSSSVKSGEGGGRLQEQKGRGYGVSLGKMLKGEAGQRKNSVGDRKPDSLL